MSGLPTTPNGYKHAVCSAVLAEHPDWPYALGLDVASRLYARWAASHPSTGPSALPQPPADPPAPAVLSAWSAA